MLVGTNLFGRVPGFVHGWILSVLGHCLARCTAKPSPRQPIRSAIDGPRMDSRQAISRANPVLSETRPFSGQPLYSSQLAPDFQNGAKRKHLGQIGPQMGRLNRNTIFLRHQPSILFVKCFSAKKKSTQMSKLAHRNPTLQSTLPAVLQTNEKTSNLCFLQIDRLSWMESGPGF